MNEYQTEVSIKHLVEHAQEFIRSPKYGQTRITAGDIRIVKALIECIEILENEETSIDKITFDTRFREWKFHVKSHRPDLEERMDSLEKLISELPLSQCEHCKKTWSPQI